jgi:hypothetical protein
MINGRRRRRRRRCPPGDFSYRVFGEGGRFIVVSLESTLDVCAKTKVEGRGCHMGGGVRMRMRVSQAAPAHPPPAAKR